MYVCRAGTLNVRNHLAVRGRPATTRRPRDEYAAVKIELAADPTMDIDTYIARKSQVLQKVLAESDLTDDERRAIRELNDPPA